MRNLEIMAFNCSCEKKELKSGINGSHEFRKEYLDSYRIANVYFTGNKVRMLRRELEVLMILIRMI